MITLTNTVLYSPAPISIKCKKDALMSSVEFVKLNTHHIVIYQLGSKFNNYDLEDFANYLN